MNSDDLSTTGISSVGENLNKRTRNNYCAICDVKTGNRHGFALHLAGRKHQYQLRRIELAGFENWAKTEARKVKGNIREAGQLEKSVRKDNGSRDPHRPDTALVQHTLQGKSKRSRGAKNKKKEKVVLKVSVTNDEEGDDGKSRSPNYSHLKESSCSEISNDSNNCSVEKTPLVPADNNQAENLSVSSPFFSSSEMDPCGNFRLPPNASLLPFPHLNPRHSSDFHGTMLDSRPRNWNCYPTRSNYRGRFQHQYGRASRMFSSAGSPPFIQQNQGVKPGDALQRSNNSRRGRSRNEVTDQTRSFLRSNLARSGKRTNQISRSSCNQKSYQKSNDCHSRYEDISSNTDPHMEATFDTQKHPFAQGAQVGSAYPKNSKDRRREVQAEHEHRHKSYSPSGSEKRRSAEKRRDSGSETYLSRRRSTPRHIPEDSFSRHNDIRNNTEIRSSKAVRNEQVQPRQTEKSTECARTNQIKKKVDGQLSSKTNENVPRKPAPVEKSTDSTQTRSMPPTSDNSAAPRSPPFSNVAMHRMNARLHSFTKYGKMPTSGQIRHLAVNSSPRQEKRDGKLQEWSKRLESYHSLSAQDKELINRLVNYSCSRREQKKLEYCLREHARSRKKLTLPRFNLQLSGMEDCKEPSGVDDNVNSMVTEVVDSLPEDLLTSLINALNSDVDEYVTVSLPPTMDTCMFLPSGEGNGVCTSPDSKGGEKRLDDSIYVTVDEVGENSSCDETAECRQQQCTSSADDFAALHLSSERLKTPPPKDQIHENSNIAKDHTSPVKATEQLARGSSLEICESPKIPNKNILNKDKEKTVSVEFQFKEELIEAQGRNIGKHPDINKHSLCSENVDIVVAQNSGNPVKTVPNVPGVSIQVKKEKLDAQIVGIEILDVLPVASHSSNRLPLIPCVNSHGLDSTVKTASPLSENIRPYPGLSYIIKPTHKPAEQRMEKKTGADQANTFVNSGNIFNPSSLDCNGVQGDACTFYAMGSQQFQLSSDLSSSTPVIKVEQSSDTLSNGGIEAGEFLLPKISSVTSVQNSENFMGNNSGSLAIHSEAPIKQEPVTPTKVPQVTLNDNAGDKSEMTCSESVVGRTPPTESCVSVGTSSNTNHSVDSHIHRTSSLSQKGDADKISEVSSSTGILLDEVRPVPVISPDSVHRSVISRPDGTTPDLIKELLSITSSEEKLVQQGSEADRTIAQLTASLEEWKRKKYEIEHEQMKLRMKRQELLLRNAVKGSVPHNKYSNTTLQSAASDKTSQHDSSSDDEEPPVLSMQSASMLSCEKSSSESASTSSESPSRSCHHSVSNFRKKRKKVSHGKVNKLRNKRHSDDDDDDLSNSSVSFINRQASKSKKRSRLFLKDDQCSSSDKSTWKKRCLDISPQVVSSPLQLKNGGGGDKTIVNNKNDDIIILGDSPHRSLGSTEEAEEDSSSEDGSVIIQEDETESLTSQEDVIAPTPDTLINITKLAAHNAAIIDLKVYDGYLYSCSLDCTAKRFSLEDPQNDNTAYEGHQKTVTSLCLSPQKEVYTTCSDSFLRCFAANSGVQFDSYEMKSGIACSCAGRGMLYLGLNSGEVIFFSFQAKKAVYELKSASCSISRLATVTQGAQRLLCVVANDGIVSLYDTATGLLLRCLETHVRPPCCIQICDDSVYVTTSEKSIVIHSLLSGKLVRMVNWAASATGLEIINNYILTSSYDGLIRCHDINQDMVSHSIYYGAGSAMVMSMTAYKEWVFTGNRKGIIEAFKFDPSSKLACQYGRCRLKYGRECDVLHHVTIDHLPCVNLKTKKCPWRGCNHEFTPRITVEDKKTHVKDHLICTY